jgi:hypothetical protein
MTSILNKHLVVTKLLLVWGVFGFLLHGNLGAQHPNIQPFPSFAERVVAIKKSIKDDHSDTPGAKYAQRISIIRDIVGISRSRDPNAVAALMDLVLYEPLSDFDKGIRHSDDFSSLQRRVSHHAVWALLQYALTELPVIPDSNLPDFPGRDDPDPEKRRLNLANYYYYDYDAALIACRAWCQEVREGKRSFQLIGSKIRYNHLGQPANAPPPRIPASTPKTLHAPKQKPPMPPPRKTSRHQLAHRPVRPRHPLWSH